MIGLSFFKSSCMCRITEQPDNSQFWYKTKGCSHAKEVHNLKQKGKVEVNLSNIPHSL